MGQQLPMTKELVKQGRKREALVEKPRREKDLILQHWRKRI